VAQRTDDEIGQIAGHTNRLLGFLEEGLSRINERVTQLTGRPPRYGENQLEATVEMVEQLADATRFKATIEEDETKSEIYERFGRLLDERFGIQAYSVYETFGDTEMTAMVVDGEIDGACRWCDPQILVRSESCRAKRSGHPVDGLLQPGTCLAFRPTVGAAEGQAELLKQSVRASDLLIRFGGEEFLIVLQDTDAEGALGVAEKIRTLVAGFELGVAGAVLQKTVSIGLAIFPEDSETFWQALKYADVALYRAKEAGRNRVVRFTPDMWEPGQDVY